MTLAILALALQSAPIEDLIERLGSDEVQVRDRASAALRKLGPTAALALQRALSSSDAEVRARASDLLAPPPPPGPAPTVFGLRNADPSQVAELLRELFRGGPALQAACDPRTRSVIVQTDPDTLRIIRELVGKLDE